MAPLKGVNRVRRTNSAGQRVEYWYAWRGKDAPCILAESAVSDALLDLKVAAASAEAGRKYFEVHAARKAAPRDTILAWSKAWQGSPEFKAGLAERTQKDYRRALAVIEADLGSMPVAALKADGARSALLRWRNRYQETPANADRYASTLSCLIGWARDQGLTSADPMREWPWIYHPDRSDIVWKAEEIEAVCRRADPELQLAVLLAAYSGLRQCDLIRLTWSAVDDAGGKIIRRTRKRGRVVHIPITPALRMVLEACRRSAEEAAGEASAEQLAALTILTRNGRPWKASTLNKAWQAARAAAAKEAPGIEEKRWHDLRGTYATSLHREGYTDDEVDLIMGWAKGSSGQTRAAYVSGDVIAHLAIARAQRRQFAQARASS